jgi:Raf kinase inhibitor-like YbhB/YbcL family protein
MEDPMPQETFAITSHAIKNEHISRAHTADGNDEPLPLELSHPPDGTQTFAVIMDDPDAPKGTFTHWVLFDIPADVREVSGASPRGVPGRNDSQGVGYYGPKPPPHHGDHRYRIRAFALDTALGLPAGSTRREVEAAMKGHVIDEAQLDARYGRR